MLLILSGQRDQHPKNKEGKSYLNKTKNHCKNEERSWIIQNILKEGNILKKQNFSPNHGKQNK